MQEQSANERPGEGWTYQSEIPGAILRVGLRLKVTAYPPEAEARLRAEGLPPSLSCEGTVLSVEPHPTKPGGEIVQIELGGWSRG
jgi:hypothetical protein